MIRPPSAPTALAALVVVTAVLARRPIGFPALRRLTAILEGPILPWVVGLGAAVAVWCTWGSLDPMPVYHDEAAYLLQAQLLARGVIAAPPAPIPEFFQQFYVFVTPVLASKYPPGFALSMVPGIWLGLPALMPILLTGAAAGLGFVLSRRASNGAVALLGTVLWLIAPGNLLMHAGYFSEALTSALWLAGWWALLRWREAYRTRFLVLLAACVGALAMTRPFTAVLYALPIGVVVLLDLKRRSAWRQLWPAAAGGIIAFGLLPIQNRLVTGHWSEMAYSLYTNTYLPYDRMGFGLHTAVPKADLPPDLVALTGYFEAIHQAHTVARLPETAVDRITALLWELSNHAPFVFGLLALLGLRPSFPLLRFASAATLVLFAGHLFYAHQAAWYIYYEEVFPVITLLVAVGLAEVVHWTARLAVSPLTRESEARREMVAIALAAVAMLVVLPSRVQRIRFFVSVTAEKQARFRDLVRRLPARSIVFVRYAPQHDEHYSLITNPPDYTRAPAWIVYDRGEDDQRLMALAPDRIPYLYLEAEHRLTPMTPGPGGESSGQSR